MSSRPVRHVALFMTVALIAGFVAPSRAQEKKKDPADVMKSLERMVRDYQDENAALKERVTMLERQVEALKQSRVVNVAPPQPGPAGQVPPSWKPFQFNGATYFLVPLAAGQGNDAAVKTLITEPASPRLPPAEGGGRAIPRE